MFDKTWLRVQPTWVLADALDSVCDALEGGGLSFVAMCQAWCYMQALRRELLARGCGHSATFCVKDGPLKTVVNGGRGCV